MKNNVKYSISVYTDSQITLKLWAKTFSARVAVKRTYKWAMRQLKKSCRNMFSEFPNNHHSNKLQIGVNIDFESASSCGGGYYPEYNEIAINKYIAPITDDKEEYFINLFKDKQLFRKVVVHELIHYAFTEFEYTEGNDEPISWIVGLCSRENTSSYADKDFESKWKIDEWLDEVLTERLAMHISGYGKTGTLLNDSNVSDVDRDIFEKVKKKLIVGPVEFESIVNALYFHDKDIFLEA